MSPKHSLGVFCRPLICRKLKEPISEEEEEEVEEEEEDDEEDEDDDEEEDGC